MSSGRYPERDGRETTWKILDDLPTRRSANNPFPTTAFSVNRRAEAPEWLAANWPSLGGRRDRRQCAPDHRWGL